jgi:hypothetical protein
MAYEYGEGNGSADSRDRAIADFAALEHPVVEQMGEL